MLRNQLMNAVKRLLLRPNRSYWLSERFKASDSRLQYVFSPYEAGVGPLGLRGFNADTCEDFWSGANHRFSATGNRHSAHPYLPFSHCNFVHGFLIPGSLLSRIMPPESSPQPFRSGNLARWIWVTRVRSI